MSQSILSLEIRMEQDVVLARQRARQVAGLLGFDVQDQTRLATAVSEIARNAFQYAGGGRVEFVVDGGIPQTFLIRVTRPRARPRRSECRSRRQISIVHRHGARDHRRSAPDGSVSRSTRHRGRERQWSSASLCPKNVGAVTAQDLSRVAEELARRGPQNPLEEVQQQNQELLRTLEELRLQQLELARANEELREHEAALTQLNRELEDTNRGVVALYAELDEKADFLRRASEMKSRFLSNMSHEFRTPLNAITGLSRLLLDRTDGDLTAEQEKQVTLIRRAAEELAELVNDLLDLAKVEAGKVAIRPVEFDVSTLFAALRGMLRPLLASNSERLAGLRGAGDRPDRSRPTRAKYRRSSATSSPTR